MKREAYLVALLMAGMGTSALAQIAAPPAGRPSLHLLSASPTRNLNVGYDADLYGLDEQGRKLQLIRTVVRAADGVGLHRTAAKTRLCQDGAESFDPARVQWLCERSLDPQSFLVPTGHL
jgi:hypothetical protein